MTQNAETVVCHYCGTADDIRPYGPGGSWTCFPCMKASPERGAVVQAAFGALLDANEAVSKTGAVLLTSDGPVPFEPEQSDGFVT